MLHYINIASVSFCAGVTIGTAVKQFRSGGQDGWALFCLVMGVFAVGTTYLVIKG